jgi:hypothetical protein
MEYYLSVLALLLLNSIFVFIVYCLVTKKINFLLNFAILEAFSTAIYALLSLLCMLLIIRVVKVAENALMFLFLEILWRILRTRMLFSSVINYTISLRSARRNAKSSFIINYRDLIASFIFTIVVFVLFMLVDIYSSLRKTNFWQG